MTCFTEVNHQNRSFNIEFAVANIEYNILGAPFFKKHIQNIDFQQNIVTCKEHHPKFPTKRHFSTFTEKDYRYVSYTYTIKCKLRNQFISNQDQERLYISQSKIILTCNLN